MANLKFSQFETKTVITDVNFLVGYTALENVQISTSDLFAGLVQELLNISLCGMLQAQV